MRRFAVFLCLTLALAALAAVIYALATRSNPAPADPRKKVLVTFTILADITRAVAGDGFRVESITKPGAEIHHYEPTPSDIARTQDAALVITNGLNLERWVERFMTRVQGVPTVVASAGIVPVPIGDGPYLNQPNPHAWMSPANALIYIENIRAALVALDPAQTAAVNANAARYSAQMRTLDQHLRTQLATIPPAQRVLVTSEGAFSYFTRDYGLEEMYLWPVNGSDEAALPRVLVAVIAQVRQRGIPTVFTESTVSPKPAQQVATGSGARFGGILYVDSLTGPDGPAPTVLKLLQYNADLIVSGLRPTATAPGGGQPGGQP